MIKVMTLIKRYKVMTLIFRKYEELKDLAGMLILFAHSCGPPKTFRPPDGTMKQAGKKVS